jgi:hypothetical protein
MSEIIFGAISVLATGVISGLVASVVFYYLLQRVRPEIYVSDKVRKVQTDDDGTLVQIKVVNKTGYMLTNVKYALYFCKSVGDGVHSTDGIPPVKAQPLTFIDKYSQEDKNAEYAVRFFYRIPPNVPIAEGWLEFSIYAEHEFSNAAACVKKRYSSEDIIPGIFETGISMKILAHP